MLKAQKGFTTAELLVGLFWLLIVGSYVANLYKLASAIGGEVTTMFIARCVGVFAAPLGCILGWF